MSFWLDTWLVLVAKIALCASPVTADRENCRGLQGTNCPGDEYLFQPRWPIVICRLLGQDYLELGGSYGTTEVEI